MHYQNKPVIETIRENLTPAEVLAIRTQERKAGRLVNVSRLHGNLVEIQIIHPEKIIDITPGQTPKIGMQPLS
ncbi:MAG: hypothetical protein ACPGSM_10535 [Thiolinea sp.]